MAESTQGRRRRLSRRAVLTTSAVVTGVAAAGIALGPQWGTSLGVSAPGTLLAASPAAARGVVKVERLHSEARSRWVDLVTVLPDNLPRPNLPVCLMLHGRYGTARKVGGLPSFLASAAAQGAVRPFAFVAVDGGDNYWHRQPSGDDPMAMLLEEVPAWLAERGLGGPGQLPFACAGTSMGGFGALLYARRRRERGQPLRAVAAVSPALLTSWTEMSKRNAFTDAADWASMDPLRNVDKLGDVPVGVWCGTEDRLCIEGTRQFIRYAKPVVGSLSPGGHDDGYYRKAVPEVIRFLGRYLPSSRPTPIGRPAR